MRTKYVGLPSRVIRTYNYKRNQVKDHRGGAVIPINDALCGNLDELIDSVIDSGYEREGTPSQ